MEQIDAAEELRQHVAEQEKAAQAEGLAGSAKIEVIGVRDLSGLLALLWPEIVASV